MSEGLNPHKVVGEWCETCKTTRATEELLAIVIRLQQDREDLARRVDELERFLGKVRDNDA